MATETIPLRKVELSPEDEACNTANELMALTDMLFIATLGDDFDGLHQSTPNHFALMLSKRAQSLQTCLRNAE